MSAIPLEAISLIAKDDVDYKAWIHPEERRRLLSPSEFKSSLAEFMLNRAKGSGLTFPWEKAKDKIRFRPGKVTVWTGHTHHGKTTILKYLMQYGMATGEVISMASLEDDPADFLADMVRHAAHTNTPTERFISAWCDWATGKLIVYDQQAAVTPEIIVGVMNYCAATFGVTHFVIDSLMRLNLESDNYDGQRKFFNLLGAAAKASNVHVHIVCHGRKGDDDAAPMSIFDIKGSGDIINQADNVLNVFRVKNKEEQTQPDGLLQILKQRGTPNWLGTLSYWYDRGSTQLTEHSYAKPITFFSMNDDGIPESVPF